MPRTCTTSLVFGYDGASRITSQSDSGSNPNTWTYGYDAMDRLNSAVGPTQTQGWTYDANGNRLTESGTQASTFTVSAASNRLASTAGFITRTYGYDTAGNALTYEDVTLAYNNRGRLKSTTKGTATRSYVHNALGQPIKASGGAGGTVLYAYDEAGHLLGEYSSTGALVQETIWLGDIPVATIRPGTPVQIFYVHADHLGTPVRVTQPSDNKRRWQWKSDPFGTLPSTDDPEALGAFTYNLRFPGQMFDGQAGLHQNMFRDYSPAIGRYVESDPIGLRGGVNTFGYVDQSPLTGIDPSGRNSWPIAVHGAWCGPNYTGGYWAEWNQLTPKQKENALPPGDALDAACMSHDMCYGTCRGKYPCTPSMRQQCFAECDLSLLAASRGNGFDGFKVWWWFFNHSPSAGGNAPSCKNCEKK